MAIPVPSPRDITEILGLPYGPIRSGPRETDADPGYFGPDSVTWKVMREPLLVLGSLRALLMQSAHPLVSEGALLTRSFEKDPWGRFTRTAQWVGVVVFGTTGEADRACRQVDRAHRNISGKLRPEHASAKRRGQPGVVAGASYTARDADLARWVHASIVDTLLVTYEALVGHLGEDEADRFVAEWNVIGIKMGMSSADALSNRADLEEYITDQIERGPVRAGAGSKLVAQTILHAPFVAAEPLWRASAFLSLGLLPPAVRKQFGIRWWPWDEMGFRSTLAVGRGLRLVFPRPLRESAAHKWAVRRARGELEDRRAAYA